jgi:cellulose synthase operon protein C
MRGSEQGAPQSHHPQPEGAIVELNADDLVEEVSEDRASILAAATSAQNIAMLTGTHGVVSPPLARPRARLPSAEEIHPGAFPHPDDAEIGRLRAFVSARSGEPVGEMRARLELARAELHRDNVEAARKEATAASETTSHAPAARAMLRSLLSSRENIDAQLSQVTQLAVHAASERSRADWLCERARLIEAKDGITAESVVTWNEALGLVVDHAGAIYGAEVALDGTGRHAELVEMLGRLADLVRHPDSAAWLHVERALLFDRRLDDAASARAALERALELSPGKGSVRDACVDWAVRHRDDAMLAELLETEAALESDKVRAARLELDAALAHARTGGARSRIVKALDRAHGRAPTTPLVDARVGEELARYYDEDGRHEDALRVRKAGLASLEDPREELAALRAIATSAERAGQIDDAVLALERAHMIDAEDTTLLAALDRLMRAAARHDALAVMWMREAARVEDPLKKADALLASAEAAQAAGRAGEAAKQREAAWLTAPTAPGVYDALAERLAPVAPGDAVQERIALYEHAARVTNEPERKIHLLEKIAWLKDDIAGDVAGAQRIYEEVLAIEPARLSAIVGLASVATRAGDRRALARALAAQADVTVDVAARADLRLRSAEALASVDPERALAVAEELENEPSVRARASEVVTRLHAAAQRWDRAAHVLARRAAEAEPGQKTALVLAEVEILRSRLRAPDRALEALARLPEALAGDPAVRAVALECLEMLGDEQRLRAELGALADRAPSATAAARLLVRAAELDERSSRDADAIRAYERAIERLPDEAFLVERLSRIGARTALTGASAELLSPLSHAMRTIDTDAAGSAEPLLATGARDFATLRLAERLARRAGSAPQLANALALAADAYKAGIIATRAYEGLASLVAWTLPPSGDYEPWERLLELGSPDVAAIDTLVHRAHKKVLANDPGAIHASISALVRRVEQATDDTERLLFHLDLVRLRRRAGVVSEAGGDCKRALAADPTSLTAACMLAEIAAELDDEDAAILACRALSKIMTDRKGRAELLRDAADLSISRGDKAGAAELLEDALRADPEAVQVAARLAELQRSRGAFADLARVLREALGQAQSSDAIVPIASELADVARNQLKDPLLAISALESIRAVAPTHVPALFLLAELFIGQRAWDKALDALARTVQATSERADKLVALVGRASIYRRVLDQPKLAEAELRTALEIDPHDTRAIRGLLDLGASVAKDERASLLGRLVIGESTPAERLRALIELADARRAVGDTQGAEGALVEAASLSPDLRMLERVRAAVGTDTETLARVLSRAVARAHEGGRPIDPTWLVGLGQIELDLGRFDEAIERFEEALRTDDARDEARVLLARALAARGRHEPAIAALAPVIIGGRRRLAIDANLVRLFEVSLSGAGRATEQWVARELRAVAGDLAPGEQAELDARIGNVGYAEGLSAFSLRKAVMPGALGRHPIWDVANLASGFAGKLARIGLQDQGSSTRDRVKPKAAHPIRPLFDRVLRAFELTEVELAVSDHVTMPAVACEDVPWVIVPSALGSYTDAHALAALARPMTRIALGVPWFGHLGAHEVLALLVAFARLVAPSFSARPTERVEPLVEEYETKARRAIDRRRRRLLEELEPTLERLPPIEEAAFAEAIAATEARAAFLLSGSLRASLDAVAPVGLAEALRIPGPPALAAVFGHASMRDLTSFALSGETTALRRSIGMA